MTKEASEITILIVDDSSLLVKAMVRTLRKYDFLEANIHTAHNGSAGVDTALEHNPDVIISDYNMPDMTGVEMAQQIIEAMVEGGRKVPPFIFVSGQPKHVIRWETQKTLGEHPIKIFEKPLKIAVLIKAIKEFTQS